MDNKKYYNNLQDNFLPYIVVNYLHIEINEFRECIKNGDCYESTINKWLIKLHKKGNTLDHAIQIIYRARSIFMYQRL